MRKRKRIIRTLSAMVLVLALVGVIAFAAMLDQKEDSALPGTDEMTTEESTESDGDAAQEEETDATDEATDLVYIEEPYTKVFADDRVTVVYEADLGDRYASLETASGFVKVQLNERTTGWVAEGAITSDVPTDVEDVALLTALQQSVPTASESIVDVIGKDVATVRAQLGSPSAVQRDQVNEYHFYDGFFLMVRDQTVRAVDWDRQAVVTPEVETTKTTPGGIWIEGKTYQLKLFPYSGVMRVRLEQK